MSDPLRPFRQLARNNLLANCRLHQAIAGLRPGEWQAQRTGFFSSLCATFNHIYSVDLFYLDALQGGTLGTRAFHDLEPLKDPSDLAAAQAALDTTALSLVAALQPDDLARTVTIQRASRVQTETTADTLMHLFLHSQHHRGQVHAMLSGSSVKPPQLDEFFMADDAFARADDLSTQGWSETDLG